MSEQVYWLADESKKAIGHLQEAHICWANWNNSPFKQAWVRNFIAYYSPVLRPGSWDSSLIFEGIEGELVRFFTPKARTIVRQLVSIITKQPLTFEAMAQVDGSEIIQDVKLANALSDQIVEKQNLDIKSDSLVEAGLVLGGGFLRTVWRTDKGQPHTRDEHGNIIYTGDVEMTVESVFDVFYDLSCREWENLSYAEVRVKRNRWDLIAQHEELRGEILKISSARSELGPDNWFDKDYSDEDTIYVYECYAKPSPALPKGRMLIYANDRCVFYDDINPYAGIPIEPMMPEKVMKTGIGYPMFTNIIAAQEMYDNSLSAIATNQSAFAVQNIAIPRGSNVNVQEIGGMNFLSYTPQNVQGGGKPEALQLTHTAPEVFKFAQILDEIMNDIGGLSGALRGQLPSGVTSGVAIATLSANALEFITSLAKAYYICMKKSMDHAFNAYKNFALLPQALSSTGQNNQISNSQFTGQQIQKITGVKIIISNPLMQTIAGRLEIGEKLLTMPREIWPQYVSILEGRPLQNIYKGDLSGSDLIQAENELLMKGVNVPVIATDDHARHIQEHAGLLNDPQIRMNGDFVNIVFQHMSEHAMQARSVDPFLMAMVRTGRMPNMTPEVGPSGQNNEKSQKPGNDLGQHLNGGLIAEQQIEKANPAEDMLQREAA